LPEIAQAAGGLGFVSGAVDRREEKRGQNENHAHDQKKLQ
jgi:hypothetical protein